MKPGIDNVIKYEASRRNGAGTLQLLPRLIRLRDAPGYLGMDRNKFNALVRPCLTEIPLGTQAVAFDRLDLDAWVEEYIARNGRPGLLSNGGSLWDAENRRALSAGAGSGTSINASADGAFSKALARIGSKKRNGS